MIIIVKCPKWVDACGVTATTGYHWSMRPMEEAQMVGEENPVLPSAEEHHPGTQGTS